MSAAGICGDAKSVVRGMARLSGCSSGENRLR
jgi:hypothetical protein